MPSLLGVVQWCHFAVVPLSSISPPPSHGDGMRKELSVEAGCSTNVPQQELDEAWLVGSGCPVQGGGASGVTAMKVTGSVGEESTHTVG